MSTEWELKYPKAIVQTLLREISDHTPILLDTGDSSQTNKKHMFKFELGWLLRDGLYNIVNDVWQKENRGKTPLEVWKNKIRKLRQYLRGWVKNTSGAYKKGKTRNYEEIRSIGQKS